MTDILSYAMGMLAVWAMQGVAAYVVDIVILGESPARYLARQRQLFIGYASASYVAYVILTLS